MGNDERHRIPAFAGMTLLLAACATPRAPSTLATESVPPLVPVTEYTSPARDWTDSDITFQGLIESLVESLRDKGKQ